MMKRIMEDVVREHEKFIVFVMLATALMLFGAMLYIRPIADTTNNSGVLQLLNMILGALISAFGAAVQALLKVNSPGDNRVVVDNPPSQPVPTTDSPKPAPGIIGELSESEKL